jgi:hypothetical protein
MVRLVEVKSDIKEHNSEKELREFKRRRLFILVVTERVPAAARP